VAKKKSVGAKKPVAVKKSGKRGAASRTNVVGKSRGAKQQSRQVSARKKAAPAGKTQGKTRSEGKTGAVAAKKAAKRKSR
jgi:hypothetical protein